MINQYFYAIKPFIPRTMQIALRRYAAGRRLRRESGSWPICESAGAPPPGWRGWPGGKRFALVLTHDVELGEGASRCEQLAGLEESRGFRSTFAFVPLRYETPQRLRRALADRGFEIIVHDLYHDGMLYRTRRIFERRRELINSCLRQWHTRGFASGAMHHNLPWISELDIDYDISTFDVDPFEPQSCGVGRIFPFWVQPPNAGGHGFVELPYTMPQDFTLFVLLGERTNDLWRKKLDWIARKGGMALIKTHPDYMAFSAAEKQLDRYPVELYTDFLDYVRARYENDFWLAGASDVAHYWRGLRPLASGDVHLIHAPATLCPSCREAHAEAWLTDYVRSLASSPVLPGELLQ